MPIIIYSLLALLAPNFVLLFTEPLPMAVRLGGVLLPAGVYALLLTSGKRPAAAVWWLFLFIFLGAFQIVLSYLFGRSVIAVDMFLNLLTTNGGEAGEVLGKIWPSVAIVCLLYIPLLAWATAQLCRHRGQVGEASKGRVRKAGLCAAAIGLALCIVGGARPLKDIFPVNVLYNMGLAVGRTARLAEYDDNVAGFRFGAKARPQADSLAEVYVLVIGETARWDYQSGARGDCPGMRMPRLRGTVSFCRALSESNTTHKSVPMLLTAADAEHYGRLDHERGLIAAFREAGYATAFVSNQKRNHAYIDFLAAEADTTIYINDGQSGDGYRYDNDLVPYVRRLLAHGGRQLIVLHTYGQHFEYDARYPRSAARFLPDTGDGGLLNAYRNASLNYDAMLCALASLLESRTAALLYTSDHGENLLDDSRQIFLHAAPIPTYYDIHVPLFVWLSDSYRAAYPSEAGAVKANSRTLAVTSRSVFHTMLHLAGISTRHRADTLALSSPLYREPKTVRYLNDHNEAVGLREMKLDKEDEAKLKGMGAMPQ